MKFLAFSLSLRHDSHNRKLIKNVEQIVQASGVEIEILDLLDYELPAYNGDVEATGFPANAERLRAKLETASGLIIASPEYNFSYPGHFKNTFDWVSRFRPVMPWANKTLLLLSASPSMVGGNRGLWHLRVPFEAVGSLVYPDMFSLAQSHQAWNESGQLNDAAAKRLNETVAAFLRYSRALEHPAN